MMKNISVGAVVKVSIGDYKEQYRIYVGMSGWF